MNQVIDVCDRAIAADGVLLKGHMRWRRHQAVLRRWIVCVLRLIAILLAMVACQSTASMPCQSLFFVSKANTGQSMAPNDRCR